MKPLVRYIILVFIFLTIRPGQLHATDDPKLILIHLDAVSSHYFLQEMEKGHLPNMSSFFGEEGRIDHTITYFPSKTPTIISSLRVGESARNVSLPGWEWMMDTVDEVAVKTTGTFLRMVFTKSRISRTSIIYGLPPFYWLAKLALPNTAYYLNDYNILEYYWYNIDTQGHFRGEEAYLNELHDFDRHFGRLIQRIDDDVNVIIYADHGMTFGHGIEIDDAIYDLLGDKVRLYSFPTLYINKPDDIDQIARELVDETDLDFTFFEESELVIKGYHEDATIYFVKNPTDITLKYEFTGEDVLGYTEMGYQGEELTIDEWLEFSRKSTYPMAPVIIYYHLKNFVSGDIVTLFEPDKYQQTGYSSSGNHGGFTYQDMTVPLFLKGPQLEQFQDLDYYWLPDLFYDIDGIDFNQNPPRERNFIGSRYDFKKERMVTEISFSPKYRIHFGASFYNPDLNRITGSDRIDFWGKGDLFRSYLSRFWVGTGVELKDSELTPLLMLNYDLHFRRFVIQNSFATNRPFYFRFAYEPFSWLAIETVNFSSIGIRLDF